MEKSWFNILLWTTTSDTKSDKAPKPHYEKVWKTWFPVWFSWLLIPNLGWARECKLAFSVGSWEASQLICLVGQPHSIDQFAGLTLWLRPIGWWLISTGNFWKFWSLVEPATITFLYRWMNEWIYHSHLLWASSRCQILTRVKTNHCFLGTQFQWVLDLSFAYLLEWIKVL